MKPIQFSCQLDKVSANNDRTLSLKIETQELNPGDGSRVLELMQKQIYIAMAEIPLQEADLEVPEASPEFKTDKTPSQKFRNRLYIYYKDIHGTDEGFREWYEKTLDTISQRYLDKLND